MKPEYVCFFVGLLMVIGYLLQQYHKFYKTCNHWHIFQCSYIRKYPVMPNNVDRILRMTGGFYIWCILYSDEREITLNPEYWVCGWGRAWWLVVVVMVVVVDISRYFPIETDWCPSQHFHHQTSQHPPPPPPPSLCWTTSVRGSSSSWSGWILT